MITLTTPPQIISVLGGSTSVAYNKMILTDIRINPVSETITATARLTSTVNPTMQPVLGSLAISSITGALDFSVAQLDFQRGLSLSAGQITAVKSLIFGAQNDIEAGLISLGVVDGTHSTGV